MGRRAKPVELHVLKGNHRTKKEVRERKAAEQAIRPPSDKIMPPGWLNEQAQEVFLSIVDQLKGTDLLTNADIAELAVLSDAIVKHALASRAVDEHGITVLGAQGNLIQNPAVLVASKYAGIIARLAPRFGLDPSGRASLAIPREKDKPVDSFAEKFGD